MKKQKCIVKDCENIHPGTHQFFKIPNSAINNEKWIQFFDRNNTTIDSSSFICELHFQKNMINFENRNRVRLKPSAYPVSLKT